jgi:CCR4-NOT transcription complex subunit 9
MFPNPSMYGNHNYDPHGGQWMHQQQSNHQQHQAQQAAAAAAAAQQQHYSRLAGAHNSVAAAAGLNAAAAAAVHLQDAGLENVSEDNRRTLAYVADLLKESTREAALLELSKKREQVPELALILWHSFGVMTCLTQEIISVYTLLNPSQLTAAASNRVCNALALLQCVASHNDTRTLFLKGRPPPLLFFYPDGNETLTTHL